MLFVRRILLAARKWWLDAHCIRVPSAHCLGRSPKTATVHSYPELAVDAAVGIMCDSIHISHAANAKFVLEWPLVGGLLLACHMQSSYFTQHCAGD